MVASLLWQLSVLLTLGEGSWAQESASSLFAPSASRPFFRKVQTQGDLGFETTHYTSPWPENPRLQQSQLLSADLKLELQRENWSHQADVFAGSFVDWGVSQFGVQQLGSARKGDIHSWAVGRWIRPWSEADQNWQLGLWEPRLSLDTLRPIRQGITGLFYEYEGTQNSLMIYATPVFIPTMGPEIKEKNRGLVAESRWYRAPSSSLNLFGRDVRILYSLEDVNVNQLVSNPGAGLRWRRQLSEHWAWSASYARKPINQLSLRYKRDLITSVPNPDGQAIVGPAVSYHNLWGSDLEWKGDKAKFSFSYLADSPAPQRPPTGDATNGRLEWIQQQPGSLAAYSLHAEFSGGNSRFAVDALRVFEEPTVDVDAQGIQRGSILPYRTLYTRAAKISWLESWTAKLDTSVSWLRDEDQRGDVVQFKVAYSNPKPWIWQMGADVLSVDDFGPSNSDERFINQFRVNDRVWGGVHYVF